METTPTSDWTRWQTADRAIQLSRMLVLCRSFRRKAEDILKKNKCILAFTLNKSIFIKKTSWPCMLLTLGFEWQALNINLNDNYTSHTTSLSMVVYFDNIEIPQNKIWTHMCLKMSIPYQTIYTIGPWCNNPSPFYEQYAIQIHRNEHLT